MRCDVLVIDDEPVVARAVALVLGAAGLGTVAVERGRAALEHPGVMQARLALCDMMLPDISGAEVVEMLRQRRPDLPVLVMTGYTTLEVKARVLAAGASGFLSKPFDETELLAACRRWLWPANDSTETKP